MEYKMWKSEGPGNFDKNKLKKCGENVVIEEGVRIFHPENIIIGDNVYIGHNTILKGYYKSLMIIGSNSWIGQGCFLHSAGGLRIGDGVGIGPMVKITTSTHKELGRDNSILFSELDFKEVIIEENCNIGIGAIILPGIVIGKGAKVGAGAVVTKNVNEYTVVAGVPAKVIRKR